MFRSILVVEDDPHVAELAATTLTELGFEPRVARSWREGKRALGEKRYSIILLDGYLPDATAADALSDIREIDLDYPVVVASAIAEPDGEMREDVQRMGVSRWLAKPYDRDALRKALFHELADHGIPPPGKPGDRTLTGGKEPSS